MKQKIEKLARHFGVSDLKFTSFEPKSLFDRSNIPMDYHASQYLTESIPMVEIRCDGIRLFGIDSIVDENLNLMPSCLISSIGFIAIAATEAGDIFALDCETGKVYELSHDKYNEDSISPGWNADFSDFLEDVPITRNNAAATSERSFNDIHEFLDELIKASPPLNRTSNKPETPGVGKATRR